MWTLFLKTDRQELVFQNTSHNNMLLLHSEPYSLITIIAILVPSGNLKRDTPCTCIKQLKSASADVKGCDTGH